MRTAATVLLLSTAIVMGPPAHAAQEPAAQPAPSGTFAEHMARGAELELKGNLEDAEDEYQAAVELDPNSIRAHHRLGFVLEKQGERDLAFEEYKLTLGLMEKSGEVRTLAGHTQPVRALAFSPDGALVATASDDGKLKLWEAQSGELKQTFSPGAPLKALAFSPDGTMLASGAQNGVIYMMLSSVAMMC